VVAYGFGYLIATAAALAAARIVFLSYLAIENYRVYDLYNGCGNVFVHAAKLWYCAIISSLRSALENVYVAFASVKDNFLFKNGDAFKFLTSSAAQASFKSDLNVKFYR
jgi:hypothetical protein